MGDHSSTGFRVLGPACNLNYRADTYKLGGRQTSTLFLVLAYPDRTYGQHNR